MSRERVRHPSNHSPCADGGSEPASRWSMKSAPIGLMIGLGFVTAVAACGSDTDDGTTGASGISVVSVNASSSAANGSGGSGGTAGQGGSSSNAGGQGGGTSPSPEDCYDGIDGSARLLWPAAHARRHGLIARLRLSTSAAPRASASTAPMASMVQLGFCDVLFARRTARPSSQQREL